MNRCAYLAKNALLMPSYGAEIALLLLSFAFIWLGQKCQQLQAILEPINSVPGKETPPQVAPERSPIDKFTLEVIAWRGHDGVTLMAFSITPDDVDALAGGSKGISLIQKLQVERES